MGEEEVREPATPADGEPAISAEEVSALLEPKTAEAVRAYEFPVERTERADLPMLELIAKTFAERGSSSLSALLSRETHLTFESLQPMKVADLLASLPAPVALPVLRLKPLPGLAVVRLEPAAVLALLDAFYGGAGQPTEDALAAVAPAAQRFLTLLLRSLAPDWSAAWAPVSALELELVKHEQNPRLLPLGAPQDAVLVLRFTVELGTPLGRLEWLLPAALLAPVREALAAAEGAKPATAAKQEPWAPALTQALQDAEIELRAVLGRVQISLGGLVRLTPGDIIPIDAPEEATLMVGDVALRRARFGVSQGRNALKILTGGPSP